MNVRRLRLIAWREYLSYVRTVGFWLSMLLMPVGLSLGVALPGLMDRAAPAQTLAIVDLTGSGYAPRVAAVLREKNDQEALQALRLAALTSAGPETDRAVRDAFHAGGLIEARREYARRAPGGPPPTPPTLRLAPIPPEVAGLTEAAAAEAALRPYLDGDRTLPNGQALTAAAVIRDGAGAAPALDFWTANVSDDTGRRRAADALEHVLREDRLRAMGLDPTRLAAADPPPIDVRTLSPRAKGEVSLRDRLPAIVGFGMGMLLWSLVLTGAGILLNSVIEEKSSRILEVLLASASTVEIMGGKIAGVALVTLTVVGVWAGIGGTLLLTGAPGLAGDLGAVLFGGGMLSYFALYLVGGYLMYAALFTAIGAFCETTREAQTLLGPVMVMLTVPVLFMTLALRNPEAEVLRVLSWIPPFTPFIMAARAGGDPAWWEVAGTAAVMAATAAAVLWLSGKAFRAGALSTVKLSPAAIWRALQGR